MLWDPERHEALQGRAWDEAAVQAEIERIVADAEIRYSPTRWWPSHPLDLEPGDDAQALNPSLYYGACGAMWALHHLKDLGAVELSRSYHTQIDALLQTSETWLGSQAQAERASMMMGATPIRLWDHVQGAPDRANAEALQALIRGNIDHPARELMWGSPGTLLAALFLHQRTGESVWADLFRETAARLWSQLEWSDEFACHYWSQELYRRRTSYLDAVHGFVGTASPLIAGRALLAPSDWARWQGCIANTVRRTATWDAGLVNWRAVLTPLPTKPLLMQYCHGSPGFLICLGSFPSDALDDVLLAAGEATWLAGPLKKGSNLCHGTGGNGYAFLKLWQRTGDARWLQRAQAFAMHGIAQTHAAFERHGCGRYSLWTGDIGFAIYLWNCLRGNAEFPTLDVF